MNLEVDIARIEQGAIEQVSEQILDESDLRTTIRDKINDRVDKIFSDEAEMMIAATVRASTVEAFDRAYQPVDAFGKPNGDETSIRKQMQSLIDDFWTQKVDGNGAPIKKDSYSHREAPTRAMWMLTQISKDDLSASLKQELVNSAAQIKDGFRKELRAQVDNWLGELFKVRSQMDQDEGRR